MERALSRAEWKAPLEHLPSVARESHTLYEVPPFTVAWLRDRYGFSSAELAGVVAELAFPKRRAAE